MTSPIFSLPNYPVVIAELSGNHNGELQRAFSLMEAAKEAGAYAIKLQTYTADTMTIDHDSEDFQIRSGPWRGYKLYDLYQVAHTPWAWHEALFKKGRELGILVFSTPFDETAVDFLESFEVPLYKIASFEMTDHNLLAYVASKRKPIILSTGLANFDEIAEAVKIIKQNGCEEVTLLHCISAYPAQAKDYNLRMLMSLKERFGVSVGISDHTVGTTVAATAVALGACVIEKHFTLSRRDGGVDSGFSAEPAELKFLCEEVQKVWESLGNGKDTRSASEIENKAFRRSIYPIKDIKPGEKFSEENVRCIRPGYSLPPKHFTKLLGRKADRLIKRGERLNVNDLLACHERELV